MYVGNVIVGEKERGRVYVGNVIVGEKERGEGVCR